ncbi:hypothetical protein [Ruegeria sp. Alg231-54]|uniref:hypothetical protein n=1 Tax=Ruegeria sp. Alg231-54 TaxID=1922221 RepID=UPI000D54E447|nr:hypothetical protein [Ruegeria sp. Alg231-54]
MKKSTPLLLVSTLALAACSGWSESRVNPTNWFGSSTPAPTEVSVNEADALVPEGRDGPGLFSRPEKEVIGFAITKVDELRIDPTSTGAIIYVKGTASRQGAYNARLVRVESEENEKNGILEYTFEVSYPSYATNLGSERSREVNDATTVGRDELRNIRLVRVRGEQNTLESRRR